jgi:hypothetical protein
MTLKKTASERLRSRPRKSRLRELVISSTSAATSRTTVCSVTAFQSTHVRRSLYSGHHEKTGVAWFWGYNMYPFVRSRMVIGNNAFHSCFVRKHPQLPIDIVICWSLWRHCIPEMKPSITGSTRFHAPLTDILRVSPTFWAFMIMLLMNSDFKRYSVTPTRKHWNSSYCPWNWPNNFYCGHFKYIHVKYIGLNDATFLWLYLGNIRSLLVSCTGLVLIRQRFAWYQQMQCCNIRRRHVLCFVKIIKVYFICRQPVIRYTIPISSGS